MKAFLKRLYAPLGRSWYRRNYYLSRIWSWPVPVRPLSYLPDRFTVHRVADTGIALVENFCTQAEAQQLIEKARSRLSRNDVPVKGKTINVGGGTSETAMVFDWNLRDVEMLPLLYRGAMLAGVPYSHIEAVYVTRYSEGDFYEGHVDFGKNFLVDRLYTILIYLNDLSDEAGGETMFSRLNLTVQPKLGRAVCWTNINQDGTGHIETSHAALPVTKGAEKWVVQLWIRPYPMFREIDQRGEVPQTTPGLPLQGDERLPDGASRSIGAESEVTDGACQRR